MTSLAGRLAAGRAAIFAVCAMYGQAVAAIPAVSASSATAPDNTAPTIEQPVKPQLDADDLVTALQNRYISLFEKYHNAVVRINVVTPGESPESGARVIIWTGFFIDRNGDILTTHADKLQNSTVVYIVDGDGAQYGADVVASDPVTNVALLHANNVPKNFTYLDRGADTELPPIGSMMLAITSKQGQSPGPSAGMVQGYNVNFADVHLPTLHLRVNIPDDGGEGGAPVLDLQGKLAGMMIASLPDSRSCLVLPARAALRVSEDLKASGKVAYGLFGFDSGAKVGADNHIDVVITNVYYDGPARAAGLQVGDVLKSIGDTPINSDMDLRQVSFFSRPGQDLPVVVQRGLDTMHLTLHVGERQLAATPTATDTTAKPAVPQETPPAPVPPTTDPLPTQAMGNPPPVIAPGGK